jgi:hypothetical protein
MKRGHHQSTRKSNHTLFGITTTTKKVDAQVLADVLLKEKKSEILMVDVIYAAFHLSK